MAYLIFNELFVAGKAMKINMNNYEISALRQKYEERGEVIILLSREIAELSERNRKANDAIEKLSLELEKAREIRK